MQAMKAISLNSVFVSLSHELIPFKCLILFIVEDKLDELKIIFLEEEIKELKHALREVRNRNTYLTQVVEQNEEAKKKQWVL